MISLLTSQVSTQKCLDASYYLEKCFAHKSYKNFASCRATDVYVVFITVRYDSVYLTYSEKLTGSQLSLPHAMKKIKM